MPLHFLSKDFEILDFDPPYNPTSYYCACHFGYNLALRIIDFFRSVRTSSFGSVCKTDSQANEILSLSASTSGPSLLVCTSKGGHNAAYGPCSLNFIIKSTTRHLQENFLKVPG